MYFSQIRDPTLPRLSHVAQERILARAGAFRAKVCFVSPASLERQAAAYAWHTFLVSAAGVSVPAVSSIAGTWWGCQTETRSKKDKMDREFNFESLQVLGWLNSLAGDVRTSQIFFFIFSTPVL